MTTLVYRTTSAWRTSNRWWADRPHAMALLLLGFACLFAVRCAYDYLLGDMDWAVLGAVCAGLAVVAAVFESFRVQFRLHLERVRAGQSAVGLPGSLRGLVNFVDASAASVLDEGHAAGVDAADRALDQIGDNTLALVEKTTAERVLELAFERNAAGQGA
jgi:hypothetical protein